MSILNYSRVCCTYVVARIASIWRLLFQHHQIDSEKDLNYRTYSKLKKILLFVTPLIYGIQEFRFAYVNITVIRIMLVKTAKAWYNIQIYFFNRNYRCSKNILVKTQNRAGVSVNTRLPGMENWSGFLETSTPAGFTHMAPAANYISAPQTLDGPNIATHTFTSALVFSRAGQQIPFHLSKKPSPFKPT